MRFSKPYSVASYLLLSALSTQAFAVAPNVVDCNNFLPGVAGNNLTGTIGNDTVYLNSGNIGRASVYNDRINSRDGNDIVYSNNGDDCVDAGGGSDEVGGGNGNDALLGGSGNDTLYGGDGDDLIRAGSGTDVGYGGPGVDVFYDTETAFQSSPTLGSHASTLSSSSEFFGGLGDDTFHVYAGEGATVYGGQDNDTYIILKPTKRTAAENSKPVRIIDVDGENTIEFPNEKVSNLSFSRTDGMLNFYDTETGAWLVSVMESKITSYNFEDFKLTSDQMKAVIQ